MLYAVGGIAINILNAREGILKTEKISQNLPKLSRAKSFRSN